MRANPKVTRSKEEAKKSPSRSTRRPRAARIFKELVKEYSDEPRAAELAAGSSGASLGTACW